MPFFGFVWAASWVSCLLTSHPPFPLLARSPVALSLPALKVTVRSHLVQAQHQLSRAAHQIIAVGRGKWPHPWHAAPSSDPEERSWQASPHLSTWPSPTLRLTGTVPLHKIAISTQKQIIQLASQIVVAVPSKSTLLPLRPVLADSMATAHNVFTGLQSLDYVSPLPSSIAILQPLKPHSRQRILQSLAKRLDSQMKRCALEQETTQPPFRFQLKPRSSHARFRSLSIPKLSPSQLVKDMAQHLRDTDFDASQIQPTIINGAPGGKVGDRILFTIQPEAHQKQNCDAELAAIDWVNGLRLRLHAAPLPLPEAQQSLHGLQETSRTFKGLASWYGPHFHGRLTATGETFNQEALTAAHPSLPFDTYVKVTNVANGKSVIVRINDRGPYFGGRAIDLSKAAARSLDSEKQGVVAIEARVMKPTAQPPLKASVQAETATYNTVP